MTKEHLINEVKELRKQIAELEKYKVERRRIEAEVKTLNKQIEFILSATKTGLDIIDSKFNIRYIDPWWEKVYGDPTGKKCYEYFMGRNTECPDCGIAKAMITKNPVVTEEILVKENNRPIQVTTIPFLDNDGEWLFAEINVDITERKRAEEALQKSHDEMERRVQERTAELTESNEKLHMEIAERKRVEDALRESEERYRSLFEESRDAIYINTVDGKFIDVNQSALDLFGYTREEMIGLDARKLYVNPDDRTMFQQEVEQKGYVKDFEVKFRGKDGSEIICLLTSTVRCANDGSILGYQGIIRDITEKRKMEEELLKTQKLESIGVLAGGIAHDFNNILTAILGNITLAITYARPEDKIFQRLIEAERASMHAKDLTQQLLTFSKGGAPIKKVMSIEKLVEDSVRFALRGSNVKCEITLPDNLWTVEVDGGQMNQVINNLFINADHAMPEGGIIRVCAENIMIGDENELSLKAGKYVKIAFGDQGVGIPKEHLPKVFDPYFTTKQKGSGLGLATAYSIIKRHDGYIMVESKLGVGTTIHVYLPASPKGVPQKIVEKGEPLVGKGNILLMDDEEMVRGTAGEMLNSIGYKVEFAGDGAEAIEIYKKAKESGHPFKAVIVDLTIPGGMGGKKAIKKLLEIDPKIKAIVSSGYSNDPIMADFRKYGFSGVIAKPYKIKELSEILHKVITNIS